MMTLPPGERTYCGAYVPPARIAAEWVSPPLPGNAANFTVPSHKTTDNHRNYLRTGTRAGLRDEVFTSISTSRRARSARWKMGAHLSEMTQRLGAPAGPLRPCRMEEGRYRGQVLR